MRVEKRKIIHLDMDAFFASVEQRDNAELKGKPIIVGGFAENRGVVATCSYEARIYGIHSAMPTKIALELCPDAIVIPPRISIYREESKKIFKIFERYTSLIEPMSYDEAFLDVTINNQNCPSATILAKKIKEAIFDELKLTVSAGVSFNKFLAKIASGYNKPDGLTIITPDRATVFIEQLPIERFYGIGAKAKIILHELNLFNGKDLKEAGKEILVKALKTRGERLYSMAIGIDDRPVINERIRKSIGQEISFTIDLNDELQLTEVLRKLTESLDEKLKMDNISAKSLILKIRYSNYKIITKRSSFSTYSNEASIFYKHASDLFFNIYEKERKVRKLGVTLTVLSDSTGNGSPYLFNFNNSI